MDYPVSGTIFLQILHCAFLSLLSLTQDTHFVLLLWCPIWSWRFMKSHRLYIRALSSLLTASCVFGRTSLYLWIPMHWFACEVNMKCLKNVGQANSKTYILQRSTKNARALRSTCITLSQLVKANCKIFYCFRISSVFPSPAVCTFGRKISSAIKWNKFNVPINYFDGTVERSNEQ